MSQLSFAIPRTECSFIVGQIPMLPAFLAGHWGLCVPSIRLLEVQSIVSVPSWVLRWSVSPPLNMAMGKTGNRRRETWVQVLLWFNGRTQVASGLVFQIIKWVESSNMSSLLMACNKTYMYNLSFFFFSVQGTFKSLQGRGWKHQFWNKKENSGWVTALSFTNRMALAT